MKKILLCTMIFSILLSGCMSEQKQTTVNSTSPTNVAVASATEQSQDFSYTDLTTGNKVKLSELRGKPVFLNFWATWCPPCIGEMPHIQKAFEQYKDKIHFLAISVDEDPNAPIKYLKSKNYSFTFGYGNINELGEKYKIEAIPSSYIIDAEGNIKAQMVGAMDEESLKNFLNKAL